MNSDRAVSVLFSAWTGQTQVVLDQPMCCLLAVLRVCTAPCLCVCNSVRVWADPMTNSCKRLPANGNTHSACALGREPSATLYDNGSPSQRVSATGWGSQSTPQKPSADAGNSFALLQLGAAAGDHHS